jgi:Domain of unknown function (DUF1996)
MPVVNDALIPAPALVADGERSQAGAMGPPRFVDGVGAARFVCGYSHMAFDDPIVYPGEAGRSHLHTYFGATGVNAATNTASLHATPASACAGGTLNRSAYWAPSVIDTRDGRPIVPSQFVVYYKGGYNRIPLGSFQAPPSGLRMIAGDAKNASALPSDWSVRVAWNFSCHNAISGPPSGQTIPDCPVGSQLLAKVIFPQCWDGVNLDSPDHKSHMSYPIGEGGGACPASHPVAIAEITYNIYFDVTQTGQTRSWRLASDNYSGLAGYSMHADWWNGWQPQTMQALVNNCLRTGLDCGSGNVGDARLIY